MLVVKIIVPCALLVGAITGSAAQNVGARPGVGSIVVPLSSVRRPQVLAAGLQNQARAFTNVQIFVPAVEVQPPGPAAATSGYFIETPASIACVYGLAKKGEGCNPNQVRDNSNGGSKAIALVDAFDAPNIISDLKVFSDRFNLRSADLTVLYAAGQRPIAANHDLAEGWELEESLDVEWAHAIAPGAKLALVEASSNSAEDLLIAEDAASQWVSNNGGGEVSNSWGVSEFNGQSGSNFEKHFNKKGVVYFAASGDSPGVSWPSTSPNVVCVGGTSIQRNNAGDFMTETTWDLAGAGRSEYFPRPIFQNALSNHVGGSRSCVDVAAIADPSSGGGLWVYDSAYPSAAANHGWIGVGGTSAATPIVAAMANVDGRFAASSNDELGYVYGHVASYFQVTSGSCGPEGAILHAGPGWNFCTGVGRPSGKDAL
jgi:kumamolisin